MTDHNRTRFVRLDQRSYDPMLVAERLLLVHLVISRDMRRGRAELKRRRYDHGRTTRNE